MGRVLRIGLTGGVGSGKSTVAQRLVERGATLIDADVLAREVLTAGSDGLAAVVERFGSGVLDSEGALNRAAMAEHVFADDSARVALNEIVHPRVAARTAELMAAAPRDALVVHDVPLLVENDYVADYHLVVVVDAPVEDRIRRLAERGLDESDARARIQAQASDQQRWAAADVWLDNSGTRAGVLAEVDRLWTDRLVPFESNVRLRERPSSGPARVVQPDAEWPARARRLIARVEKTAGTAALRVDHIGSTSVPGLAAKDAVDLQLSVRSPADADALRQPLSDAGFPVVPDVDSDEPKSVAADPREWGKNLHVSADPAQPVNLHVRVAGRANWRYALLFPAWLRADSEARREYEALKRELASRFATDPENHRYVEAKEPWFDQALPRAEQWARTTGWQPPEV